MYKVLVTTMSNRGVNYDASINVHTVVVEFSSRADAENAVKKINDQLRELSAREYKQWAIMLS
jgi:hypothetical protein